MKYDDKKPPIHLVPAPVVSDVARVFAFGAQKYGENNWRKDATTTEWCRTYSSIQRHLLAWLDGEDFDSESGLHHIDHAITQCMILKMHIAEGPNMDDRFKSASKK